MIEFKHLEKALEEYGNAVLERYKDNLRASDRVASGELINSLRIEVNPNDNTSFEVILSLNKYWEYIEYGTGLQHKPEPRQPYKIGRVGHANILKWVKIKINKLVPKFESQLPMDKQYDRIAWAVHRKLEREGMKGKPDLENALDSTDEWEEIITEALDADIWNAIDEILVMA